jgi:hypothetical protein
MKNTIALLTLAVVCLAGCSSTSTHASPKAWNAVGEGMMRQQIVNSIGQPASQSASSEIWRSEGWELRIAYDESGRATNVVRMLILK